MIEILLGVVVFVLVVMILVTVILGAPLTCCDESSDPEDLYVLTFSDVRGAVRVDGTTYTADGSRTSR